MDDMKIEIMNGKASAYTPYNKAFIAAVKGIGGKWDGECWAVSAERVDELNSIIHTVYGDDAEIVRYTAGIRRPTFAEAENAINVLPYRNYEYLPYDEAQDVRYHAIKAVSSRISKLAARADMRNSRRGQVITTYAFAEWLISTKKSTWWIENAANVDPERGATDPLLWMLNNNGKEFEAYVTANGGWAKEM